MLLWSEEALEQAKSLRSYSQGILNCATSSRRDVERAIQACEKAISLFDAEADPILWLDLQCKVCFAALRICAKFRTHGLIPILHRVLRILPYDPGYQHVGFANWLLAKCWDERADCARAESWARAVHHYANAIRVFDKFGITAYWAESQNAFGDLLSNPPKNRHVHPHHALKVYIEVTERTSSTRCCNSWATAQQRVGELLLSLSQGTNIDLILKALSAFEKAKVVFRRQGFREAWAQIEIIRAKELASRRVGDADALANEARSILRQVIRSGLPRDTFAWCEANRVLSTIYMRNLKGRLASRSRCALVCLSRIVDSTVHYASISLRRDLASCLYNVGRYVDALAVVEDVIAKFERLRDEAAALDDRESLYASAYRLGSTGALALLKMERVVDALLLWETLNMREYRDACLRGISAEAYNLNCRIRSQAKIIADWDVKEANEGSSAAVMADVQKLRLAMKRVCCRARVQIDVASDDIKGLIPDGGSLIVPILNIHSSRLIVLSHTGAADYRTDLLDLGFGEEVLSQFAHQWKNTASAVSSECVVAASLDHTFHQILDWLWRSVGDPLVKHLGKLGLRKVAAGSVPDVTFICVAPFGILPLHASCPFEDADEVFLSHYAITYAPSLTVLKASKNRRFSRIPAEDSILAVIDPTACDENGRAFPALKSGAAEEVGTLRSLAEKDKASVVLEAEDCTKDRFETCFQSQTILHMMCHAQFDANNPGQSSILLSGKDRIYLEDIVNHKLPTSTALVVLASCETAMTDADDMPEEGMGFAPAFLAAGADSVVAAQWRVRNDVASRFVASFYRERSTGRSTAQAVRAASLCARQYVNRVQMEMKSAYNFDVRAPTVRRFNASSVNAVATANAFWWAPFAAWGSG